jgi:antitoxin component of MazEF toxin-antitoxin module
MRVKARRVGNSLTVTIPKDVVLETGIGENADLEIFVREGTVVLEPVISRWDRLVAEVRRDTTERGLTERDALGELEDVRRAGR